MEDIAAANFAIFHLYNYTTTAKMNIITPPNAAGRNDDNPNPLGFSRGRLGNHGVGIQDAENEEERQRLLRIYNAASDISYGHKDGSIVAYRNKCNLVANALRLQIIKEGLNPGDVKPIEGVNRADLYDDAYSIVAGLHYLLIANELRKKLQKAGVDTSEIDEMDDGFRQVKAYHKLLMHTWYPNHH